MPAGPEPETIKQALSGAEAEEWKQAADAEFLSLVENKTWTLVDLPEGKKPLKCKWVFKRKLHSDGTIEKYKARVVAKGFAQRPGIDFYETFSPVVRAESFRCVLALAAQLRLSIHVFDITAAYLNGKIDCEVYMQQVPGYSDGTNKVCKLNKSLYGLKQAGKMWNDELNKTLTASGLKRCEADPCVYVMRADEGRSVLILTVHVDDMVVVTNSNVLYNKVKGALANAYKLKEILSPDSVLHINLKAERGGIVSLSLASYIQAMLKRFGMDDCKPVSTPAVADKEKFAEQSNKEPADTNRYQEIVGSISYAANIVRPDLAYAVNVLARTAAKPTKGDMVAAKRVLRYLQGTVGIGLQYKRSDDGIVLKDYCDATWADNQADRSSTTGYVFYLAGAPVSWKCRKQRTIALSSAESEYLALGDACKEALWFSLLLKELGFPQRAIEICIDNRSAIALATNPVHHDRTKHIDLRYHFVRRAVQEQRIKLKWVSTKQMVADILTKPLPSPAFLLQRNEMLI
jgi:hypothetical protein